jgi:hypothetical protein
LDGVKLINIYPIASDAAFTRGRGRLEVDRLPKKQVFESLPLEHPCNLKSVYTENFLSTEVFVDLIGATRLTYFFDGIFSIETSHDLSGSIRELHDLISLADREREVLQNWISSREGQEMLSSISAAFFKKSSLSDRYKLTFAYSHNFIGCSPDDLKETKFASLDWIFAESSHLSDLYANSAVSFVIPQYGQQEAVVSALRNFTAVLSSLYEIQEICVRNSRKIIEADLFSRNASRKMSASECQLGLLQQFVNEVKMIDFLSDPFEEAFGKSVAQVWDWYKVRERTNELCSHLQGQLAKLHNEVERQSDARVNKILFAFTLLTVVDVAANILSFHDLQNSVGSYIRGVYIVSVFILLYAVVKLYTTIDRRR